MVPAPVLQLAPVTSLVCAGVQELDCLMYIMVPASVLQLAPVTSLVCAGVQELDCLMYIMMPAHVFSWHLSQALYALEYKNLTAYQVGCLHTSYAAQLESLGLWHWAVFVLLHLTDSHQ